MARRYFLRIFHTPGATIPFDAGVGVTGVGVAVGDDMGVAVAGTVGSAFGVDPGFGFDPGVTGFGVAVGVQVGLGVGVAVPAGPGVAGQVFGVNVPTTLDIDRFGAAGIAIEDALKAR